MPTFVQALKSKTVWSGLITVGAAAWQAAQPFIPAKYVPIALAAAGVVQIALRTVTTSSLTEK